MPLRTGTLDISSLLTARFQSAVAFGLDTINEILRRDIAVHNRILQDMLSSLAEYTTDRLRLSGTSNNGSMVEVDEYGRAPTQRVTAGTTVGFPLRKFQFALGWTQTWLRTHTPRDMAIATQAAEKAHLRRYRYEIQRAIYTPTNSTFRDFLVDNVDLAVKAFHNADGASIPEGPNGEVYDGATHTHYLGSATLTTAAVTSLINTVLEHGFGGQIRVIIAAADETAFRALSGFMAYQDPRLTLGSPTTLQPGQRAIITRLDDRPIGIYGSAEIWVKPWGLANYHFAYDETSGSKPVTVRQREDTTMQGLRIAAELDTFPLYAQYQEAEFGVGVWTRANGAVLQSNNATYTAPTLVAP